MMIRLLSARWRLLTYWHNSHGQTGNTAGLAFIAGQTDVPDVSSAADMHRARDSGDATTAQTTQVVSVDLDRKSVV